MSDVSLCLIPSLRPALSSGGVFVPLAVLALVAVVRGLANVAAELMGE